MANIPGQFNQSSPEGVISAPKGSKFFRSGDKFFLTTNGQTQELFLPKKTYVQSYQNEPWFASIKDELITFKSQSETWLKSGGSGKTGWTLLASFDSVLRKTPYVILGDITGIAAGYYQSYFLKTNGDLWASGHNPDGQLGLGFNSDYETASLSLADVSKVAASCEGQFVAALKTDNTLWVTGYGNNGQFGNGTNDTYNEWTQVVLEGDITGSGTISSITTGENYTALLMSDGTVWGTGDAFNMGTNTFMQITGSVKSIAGGGYHLLYINNDDVLFGIGDNWELQLGDGATIPFYNWDSPYQIDTEVKAIGAGGYHSGYIKNDDTLWMMGANWDSQCGLSENIQEYVETPRQIDTNVKFITGGDGYTLYIKNDNTLWGMGYNGDGELGDPYWNDVYTPTQIDTNVSTVAAGGEHTLYTKTDKTLYGMGYNGYYQLGSPVYSFAMYYSDTTGWTSEGVTKFYYNADPSDNIYWTDSVYADGKFVAVGGPWLNCRTMYSTDGQTWITGSEVAGFNQFLTAVTYGSGTFVATSPRSYWDSGQPELIISSDGINWQTGSLSINQNYGIEGIRYVNGKFVAVGLQRYVTSSNAVDWMEDVPIFDGEVDDVAYGNGTYAFATSWGYYDAPSYYYTFTQSFDGRTADSIAAGDSHAMLIKDNTLYGCGYGWSGNFGYGGGGDVSDIIYFYPLQNNVRSVACGYAQTSFVKTDSTLWGMGENYDAQVGPYGLYQIYSPVLLDTNVSQSFTSVASHTTVYIKNDNTLWGRGWNGGALGSSSFGSSVTESVLIDTNVKYAAMGNEHILYIKNDDTLWARGYNYYGQLGKGDNTSTTESVQIDTNVAYCLAAYYDSFYIKTNGDLYGMGLNGNCELGLGDNNQRNTSSFITSSVVHVASNGNSTLIVAQDGNVYGMGYNSDGRLGTGDSTTYLVPTLTTISGAKAVAIGGGSGYVLKTDNTVYVTGNDGSGRLGLHRPSNKGRYSIDGLATFSSSIVPNYSYYRTAFGNGRFVMPSAENLVISSTDGINWTSSYVNPGSSFYPSDIKFDGTKFIMCADYAYDGYNIATSTDGISWTLSRSGDNTPWGTISYGNGNYILLSDDYTYNINPEHKLTIG